MQIRKVLHRAISEICDHSLAILVLLNGRGHCFKNKVNENARDSNLFKKNKDLSSERLGTHSPPYSEIFFKLPNS